MLVFNMAGAFCDQLFTLRIKVSSFQNVSKFSILCEANDLSSPYETSGFEALFCYVKKAIISY